MAKSDLFKRSLEAGTSFIDMTRERAEAVVKDWVEAGDLGKGRAPKAVEQILDRSRKVSGELRGLIRREIANQVAALGVATRDDLARLEAKIDAASASQAPATPPVAGAGARKSAAAAKGTGGQATKATKATKAARPRRATGAAEKAAGPSSAGGAGSAPGT